MFDYITVIPAYGRDYSSQKAVKADWNANKDFQVASFGPENGRYTNKQDIEGTNFKVMVRFAKQTRIVSVN